MTENHRFLNILVNFVFINGNVFIFEKDLIEISYKRFLSPKRK